jgi:uncharacterized protein (DUF486 family)
VTLFSTPIGGLALFVRYVLASVAAGTGGIILSVAKANWLLMLLGGLLEVLALIYLLRFAVFARLASVGLSRWFALLLIVPIVSFVFLWSLLFCPAGRYIRDAGDAGTTAHPLETGLAALFGIPD